MNDVGADIEAHCPKCHSTYHTIVSKYEDEVRRVQCNNCGHIHPYKKPRDDEEAETVTPAKKKAAKQKPTWEQVMQKSKKPPRPYNIGEYFKELEIVSHPKFGVGYVTENIGNDKIEVTFQQDKRVLIHNRKGLNLPVAALRPFDPETAGKVVKVGKPPKGKAAKAEAPPAPAPATKAAKAPKAPKAPTAADAKAAPAKAAAPKAAAKPAKVAAPKAAPKAAAPKPASKKPAPKPVRAATSKAAAKKPEKAEKAKPAKAPAKKKR